MYPQNYKNSIEVILPTVSDACFSFPHEFHLSWWSEDGTQPNSVQLLELDSKDTDREGE